ncbi:UDP-4-amino-4,6-dideoxy-N-acetyl-beta-L-altrosamine transaminase [bacterium]|nr:UDP-4-amino-4,6-dideoxy-N-acetyl-beta-L-altrosamine transaminase [bacterium]
MQSNKRRLLITGVSGLLGNNLAYYFKDKYNILGMYNSHPVIIDNVRTKRADIISATLFNKTVNEFMPDVVIHCASLTDIDFCEMNRELTDRINVFGTKVVTNSIKSNDVKLIYISTDSVYDGIKGNFSENDAVNPRNYYGLTKYRGEQIVLKKLNSLILRTNLFGWNIQDKDSLAEWILTELSNNRHINGFKDACFSSIYTFEFARILDRIIDKDLTGIYNCASKSSLSKYEFAAHIANRFNLNKSLIKPISIDEFKFKAKRGKKLTLNVDKLESKLNCVLPTIGMSIESFFRDFKKSLPEKIKRRDDFIPYGRQSIEEDDIKEVVKVLRSDWITQGPRIKEFEDMLCRYTGAEYAVSVSSGTAALHIACLAAGIGADDKVITSPITFVASANCILYCGGKPVFTDIQRDTGNIDPCRIEYYLKTQISNLKSKLKAIILVHFGGHPVDLERIQGIAKEYNLTVIEDASHALGAEYKNIRIGSCKYSDMTVFSFHPVKSITTGEGGVVLTNRKDLYKKLLMLRVGGITKEENEFKNKKEGDWYYEQQLLGFNYKLTDFQCALGISQLKKLDKFVERRREIVKRYNNAFKDNEYFDLPVEKDYAKSSWHLYPLRLRDKYKAKKKEIFCKLREAGLGVQVHYIPVYLHPYYQKLGFKKDLCPLAEDFYQREISVPLYPAMKNSDIKYVIDILTNGLKKYAQ